MEYNLVGVYDLVDVDVIPVGVELLLLDGILKLLYSNQFLQ